MSQLIVPVPDGQPTFINAPRCTDLDTLDADVAIIGVTYGYPYDMVGARHRSAAGAEKVREQSMRFVFSLTHYDYDFQGDIFAGRNVKVVDCGDVAMTPGQYAENSARSTEVIDKILSKGAVPIVLGGDHAIPIPVMRAYENHGSMVIVQLDAHLDWRQDVNGVTEGLSSPMRRASEMSWVDGMAQIGLRGVGSGRQQEFDDARAYGSVLIGAQELHEIGVEAALDRVPKADRYYITFDADGLDPAIAPGVGSPGFGGITYFEQLGLIHGLAQRGKIVGFDFNEIVPAVDVEDMTSLLGARIALNVIGSLAHTGQIGTAAGE